MQLKMNKKQPLRRVPQAEWGEMPREWVTVMPELPDKSGTLTVDWHLPSPGLPRYFTDGTGGPGLLWRRGPAFLCRESGTIEERGRVNPPE